MQVYFYFGNAHETVLSARLLQDRYLTVRSEIYMANDTLSRKAFAGNLFPSYEDLQELLSDRLYQQEKSFS